MAGRGGAAGGCPTGTQEICNNGKDDNCNLLSDCQDPSCFGDPVCAPPGQEICNNALDDDDDGKIDCTDSDCVSSVSCKPTMGAEICDNGVDDNDNRLADCADPQCTTFPGCLTVSCTPEVDFGTIAAHGANVARTFDTRSATAAFDTCAPTGGFGRVGRFTLTEATDLKLDFSQPGGSAHVVGVYRAGAGQSCERNPVACVDVGGTATRTQSFPGLAAGVYWVIVDSYPGVPGATTVTLSTGVPGTPEICANGKDDDGNGLTDCQDAVCVGDPSCVGSECAPDLNIGALVPNGPSKQVTVNLATSADRYRPTCGGTNAGGDQVIALTIPAPAGLYVRFQQTGRSVFSLFGMPPRGLACDADQLSCLTEEVSSGGIAWINLAPGRYLLIVKALGVAQAGTVNLTFSATAGRPIEACGNGLDDDQDGRTDCADPDCFGVSGCPAPACVADTDLGALSWNVSRTITVDTRTGGTLYPTSCSRGTGKEKVLRLNLTQPMALGVDCIDNGSHVLALAQQLKPLDTCTANEVICVDQPQLPAPFGCNYSIPDLQPGLYNVIIQAFQAGDEGTINLTLTGIRPASGREICDNGVDDDADGAVDCADRKCVATPVCAQFACRPDRSLGLLQLGAMVSTAVQTAMADDDQTNTVCASAPGGQDADVDFRLPAKADLTLEWAQVGDHAFVLYGDQGALFACDAGAALACVSTNGMATGSIVFPGLPPGRYHLVVDANRPGKEGGVALQLSAVAATTP
jgi:hypothetical protein